MQVVVGSGGVVPTASFVRVLLQKELLEDVVWVELVSRDADLLLTAVTEDKLGVREGRVYVYKWVMRRLFGSVIQEGCCMQPSRI